MNSFIYHLLKLLISFGVLRCASSSTIVAVVKAVPEICRPLTVAILSREYEGQIVLESEENIEILRNTVILCIDAHKLNKTFSDCCNLVAQTVTTVLTAEQMALKNVGLAMTAVVHDVVNIEQDIPPYGHISIDLSLSASSPMNETRIACKHLLLLLVKNSKEHSTATVDDCHTKVLETVWTHIERHLVLRGTVHEKSFTGLPDNATDQRRALGRHTVLQETGVNLTESVEDCVCHVCVEGGSERPVPEAILLVEEQHHQPITSEVLRRLLRGLAVNVTLLLLLVAAIRCFVEFFMF